MQIIYRGLPCLGQLFEMYLIYYIVHVLHWGITQQHRSLHISRLYKLTITGTVLADHRRIFRFPQIFKYRDILGKLLQYFFIDNMLLIAYFTCEWSRFQCHTIFKAQVTNIVITHRNDPSYVLVSEWLLTDCAWFCVVHFCCIFVFSIYYICCIINLNSIIQKLVRVSKVKKYVWKIWQCDRSISLRIRHFGTSAKSVLRRWCKFLAHRFVDKPVQSFESLKFLKSRDCELIDAIFLLLLTTAKISFDTQNSRCDHWVISLYFLKSAMTFVQVVMMQQRIARGWALGLQNIPGFTGRNLLQFIIQAHISLESQLLWFYVLI